MAVNNTTAFGGEFSLDDQVIGIIYITLTLIVLIPYLPCLWVLAFDAELKSRSCLRTMLHLGITDVILLSTTAIFGFLAVTGLSYKVSYGIRRILGVSWIFGWYSYLLFVNLLSFNRCVTFCFPLKYREALFSQRATSIWLGICWFLACQWLILYSTPYSTWIYYPNMFISFYNTTLPWTPAVMKFNIWNCAVSLGMTSFWYFVIIVSLRFKVSTMASLSLATRGLEKRLLIQAAIISFGGVTTDQYWHNAIEMVCSKVGVYCYPVGMVAHILNCGINPLVYYTLNKTISQKVFELFKVQPTMKTSLAPKATTSDARSLTVDMNAEKYSATSV